MGYASISNLYADTRILEQPECYALEKIHGSSAHLHYVPAGGDPAPGSRGTRLATDDATLVMFSGAQQPAFEKLFNTGHLLNVFGLMGVPVKVHGEIYGGKVQNGTWRYGPELRFVVFDVNYNGEWLTIPEAEAVTKLLGLEFVHYVRIPTQLPLIDAMRDATSEQAIRNGVTTKDGPFIRREGVVLRPIEEKPDYRGDRICAKHKRAEERETKTIREVNTEKIALKQAAREIAEEWVTENRIKNARSHHSETEWVLTNMRNLIRYVHDDVYKEAGSELTQTPETSKELCSVAAKLIKQSFENALKENQNEA